MKPLIEAGIWNTSEGLGKSILGDDQVLYDGRLRANVVFRVDPKRSCNVWKVWVLLPMGLLADKDDAVDAVRVLQGPKPAECVGNDVPEVRPTHPSEQPTSR